MQTIHLDKQQLRKLQMEMMDLLIEFDRLCKKHKITYFLSGGTLLGAVRHQGFIPWDDDLDVEMLRDEYERFCSICEQELDANRFFFQTQQNDPYYLWTYGKLRLKNTAYIRAGQSHLKQKTGICIDVFPLDAAGEDPFWQRFHEIICKGCRKILWSRVGYKTEQTVWKRIWYGFLRYIPRHWTIWLFESVATAYAGKELKSMVFHHMDSRSQRGYIQSYTWYASCVEVTFEGKKFPAPGGYKDFLYFWYGDYMTYPPESEQVLHTAASYIRFSDQTELKAGD